MPKRLPLRDPQGNVIAYDDTDILDDDILIRRISSQHIVPSGQPNIQRIASMLYQPSPGPNGGMSIDIERSIVDDDLEPKTFVMTEGILGAVCFKAEELRKAGFLIGADPLPKNPHHGEVWGTKKEEAVIIGKFTPGQRKKLARMARWYIEISNINLIS